MTVAKMATFVVGDFRDTRPVFGSADADLDQPLVDVLDLAVPLPGAFDVEGVIVKQMPILLQMSATAASIGDDGIQMIEIKAVNLPTSEFAGQFDSAIVGVQ